MQDEALKRVNEGFRIMMEISNRLLAEKSKLEEWRKASSKALLDVRISEEMSLEERIRRVENVAKRTFGLLINVYKNMHKLVCEGFSWYWQTKQFNPQLDPSQFFIGFPDFLKIHFHTFRHFAISWYYFKTKGIVETPFC